MATSPLPLTRSLAFILICAGIFGASARVASAAVNAVKAGTAAAKVPRSQLTYYGPWDAAKIPSFQRFDVLTLQPGMYADAGEVQAIAKIKSTGTKVLLYVTIGEDDKTYDNAAPVKGDGRGPSRYDTKSNTIVYANKGIASYYMDEWNEKGADSDPANKAPDGLPDRQGDWGSCLVNAGDPAWQDQVMATVKALMSEGADGLFLDTPETADPWHGYGWTAEGMYGLIKRIRDAYPAAYLLLNRGLFFFEPVFPYQYRWSPRNLIDAVLFESYYSDSNYPVELGGNGSANLSRFFAFNKYTSAPRVNAAMGRSGNPGSVMHIDYAADPAKIRQRDSAFYNRVLQEAAVEQGWLPQITDRLLSEAPTTVLDFPPAADRSPPKWQNTAVGLSSVDSPAPPFFMAPGGDYSSAELQADPPQPRVGLLKAIPGNGKVTLRWEVAADQTRPVRYNVYYAKGAPLDFTASTRIPDAPMTESADYAQRGFLTADDASPYEFTITGLENNSLYRFAVRAEDGTSGAAAPLSGRIGPGGGIEETNQETLPAIPRDSTLYPIAIDGAFADWNPIAAVPDSAGDGSGQDFRRLRVTDDSAYLYLYLETAAAMDPAKTILLFNTDRLSYTGDTARSGSGFQGADFRWSGGTLAKRVNGAWTNTGAATLSKASGTGLEIRIVKRDMGGDHGAGINLLALTSDGKETLPDHGAAGFAFTYTHPIDASSSIRKVTPAGDQAGQFLFLEAGSGGQRLRFRNPNADASVSVRDVNGREYAHWTGLKGTEALLPPASARAGLRIVQVRARGLPPLSRAVFTSW